MADLLVDRAAKHEILSFMDGHSDYNQIFIPKEDVHKTAFRCPDFIGTFEYVVMPFSVKNVGAAYQQAVNAIFHDMIDQTLEIYIDDVVVKSESRPVGNFLGFLLHQRGTEIDKNNAKAIIDVPPLKNKKGLQSLLGQIN
ncbi:unnamed protein product [Prunus armeniaca]